jgi:hypothetical protein
MLVYNSFLPETGCSSAIPLCMSWQRDIDVLVSETLHCYINVCEDTGWNVRLCLS